MTNVRNKRLLTRFGAHLKALRTDAELTQEQLANDAEVPISQVGRIERGEVNPTLSTLSALAEALKMPLHDFIKF